MRQVAERLRSLPPPQKVPRPGSAFRGAFPRLSEAPADLPPLLNGAQTNIKLKARSKYKEAQVRRNKKSFPPRFQNSLSPKLAKDYRYSRTLRQGGKLKQDPAQIKKPLRRRKPCAFCAECKRLGIKSSESAREKEAQSFKQKQARALLTGNPRRK